MDDLTCSKVSLAVAQCPFLQAVKEFQGEDYACRLAVNPFESATNPNSQPIFPEDVSASLRSVFTLFHGREGPMTLSSSKSLETGQLPPRCPMRSVAAAELSPQGIPPSQVVQPVAAGFPMASISLSGFNFFPNPGDFFNRRPVNENNQKRPRPKRQPKCTGSSPSQGNTSGGASKKPSSPPRAPGASSNGTITSSLSGGEGLCPMRRVFEPIESLLPLVVGSQMHCPPAIVAMRTAISGLKPVRLLRPKGLPIRSLAMAGTAIFSNVPCGMWREHTEKFSPQWFVAVHATIPFVAMLRKAVLMPQWAILLTIAGALAGQQVGTQLERARLRHNQSRNSRSSHVRDDQNDVRMGCAALVQHPSLPGNVSALVH